MSGLMEILVIVAIILGIFMLPRLLHRQQEDEVRQKDQGPGLSGWKRLAILASFLWPSFLRGLKRCARRGYQWPVCWG